MSGNKQLLVDTMSFRCTRLEESSQGPGKYIAHGEFARADRPTENKRLYTHNLWERELTRLNKQLAENKVYGELDHPMDGRTQLKRVSHIVTDLRLEGDIVVGTAHILSTDAGNNLKAILDAGGSVGVSSRGFGTTKPNMKGEDVVQDDYKLMTFDFVAEPAQQTAYPVVSVESTGPAEEQVAPRPQEVAMGATTRWAEFKAQNPELAEGLWDDAEREWELKAAEIWAKKIQAAKSEATDNLRAEFAEKLEAALGKTREEIAESIRSELMGDPSVAGAKLALEQVKSILRPHVIPEDVESVVSEREHVIERLESKLADKDLQIANLSSENEKLASIAREAGYRFHLEQQLHDVPDASFVRELMGDVRRFGSIKEMDQTLASIVEDVQTKHEEETKRDAEVQKLREEVGRQRVATEKALEAAKHLAAQVYLEQRLANHPDANKVRALTESRQFGSKEDVDRLLSETWTRPSMTDDVEAARSRVRGILNSQTREFLEEKEVGNGSSANGRRSADYNGLGADLGDIRALAGMPDNGTQSN